jgi:hypothetical protein
MSWAITATVASTAYGAIQANGQASASASFSKAQSRYNDAQNAKRARVQGVAVDTNTLRARTEATATLQGITSSANEAAAQSQVAGAALNIGAGTYDTVLNTFAKKTNQAESSTMMQLVSELVGNKLQREDIAVQATAGQSVDTSKGAPSAFGAILSGVGSYFTQTNGLKNAFGSWGSTPASNPSEVSAYLARSHSAV